MITVFDESNIIDVKLSHTQHNKTAVEVIQ